MARWETVERRGRHVVRRPLSLRWADRLHGEGRQGVRRDGVPRRGGEKLVCEDGAATIRELCGAGDDRVGGGVKGADERWVGRA